MAGRLGDILVARGLISDEQLQDVLATQGSRGMLGESLVSRGLINNEQLGLALADQFDVLPADNFTVARVEFGVARCDVDHL